MTSEMRRFARGCGERAKQRTWERVACTRTPAKTWRRPGVDRRPAPPGRRLHSCRHACEFSTGTHSRQGQQLADRPQGSGTSAAPAADAAPSQQSPAPVYGEDFDTTPHTITNSVSGQSPVQYLHTFNASNNAGLFGPPITSCSPRQPAGAGQSAT